MSLRCILLSISLRLTALFPVVVRGAPAVRGGVSLRCAEAVHSGGSASSNVGSACMGLVEYRSYSGGEHAPGTRALRLGLASHWAMPVEQEDECCSGHGWGGTVLSMSVWHQNSIFDL